MPQLRLSESPVGQTMTGYKCPRNVWHRLGCLSQQRSTAFHTQNCGTDEKVCAKADKDSLHCRRTENLHVRLKPDTN